MTREEKVRENAELIVGEDLPTPQAVDEIIRDHCPGDSIFEEIFSEAELGECQLNCAEQEGMKLSECCQKHWKGEI
jgi:hypothetical protein